METIYPNQSESNQGPKTGAASQLYRRSAEGEKIKKNRRTIKWKRKEQRNSKDGSRKKKKRENKNSRKKKLN